MARPRLPVAVTKVTGRTSRTTKSQSQKSKTGIAPLGSPPTWLNPSQVSAWKTFAKEVPWLSQSDRALLEIASVLRSSMSEDTDVGLKKLTLLRQCLGAMGATPADAGKVRMPEPEVETDPADKYFE